MCSYTPSCRIAGKMHQHIGAILRGCGVTVFVLYGLTLCHESQYQGRGSLETRLTLKERRWLGPSARSRLWHWAKSVPAGVRDKPGQSRTEGRNGKLL